MKHYAALLFASALLTDVRLKPYRRNKAVAPSRLMLYQNIPDTPYATVVVVRDSGMLAGSCRTGVYVNGSLPLRWAEKAEFRVPPCNISVSIGQDMIENHLCIWRDTGGGIPMTRR